MNKIKVFKKAQTAKAHKYLFSPDCWVPGENTPVIVTRNTRGNFLPGVEYITTFRQAVEKGLLDDCRGTMTFSVKVAKTGEYLQWVHGLNTFGIIHSEA